MNQPSCGLRMLPMGKVGTRALCRSTQACQRG